MPSETVVLIIRISAKKRLKKKCLNEKLEALKKLVNCGVVTKKNLAYLLLSSNAGHRSCDMKPLKTKTQITINNIV